MTPEGSSPPPTQYPRLAAAAVVAAIVLGALWADRRFSDLEADTARLTAQVSPTPTISIQPTGKPATPTPSSRNKPSTPSPTPRQTVTPTHSTPTPTPMTRLEVTVTSTGVHVIPDDVTVSYRTLVQIANPTKIVCELGPKLSLPEITAGDSTLEPGAEVTLLAPDHDADLKLSCVNAQNPNAFFVRSRAQVPG